MVEEVVVRLEPVNELKAIVEEQPGVSATQSVHVEANQGNQSLLMK